MSCGKDAIAARNPQGRLMPGISLPPKDRSQSIQEFFVGIDVGGTNIKVGVVTSRGRPLSHVVVPTEADKGPDHGLATIHRAIEQAVDERTWTCLADACVTLVAALFCNPFPTATYIGQPAFKAMGARMARQIALVEQSGNTRGSSFRVGIAPDPA